MPWPTTYTSQGLVQAVIQGRLHGQVTNNVLWFTVPSELGTPDWPALLANLAADIISCVVSTLLPGVSSQWAFETVRTKLMSVPDKIEVVAEAPANSVGALGESLPSHVAATVTLYTPYADDKRRGGMRIAGIPEANQAQSVMSGTPNTQIIAFVACMLGKFKHDTGTNTNFDWVIFSRKLGYTPPSTYNGGINNIAPVVRGVLRTNLGSQNSRKLNRGS